MTKKRHSPWQALSTASSTRRVLRGQFHGSSTTRRVLRGQYHGARHHAASSTRPAPRGRTARRSVPTSEVLGLHPRILQQTQPHLSTSEVGRFLRKRRSGEHDKEAPLSLASTLDGQFHGSSTPLPAPRGRTARRSVPTSEILGLHLGFLPQTQPRPPQRSQPHT